MKKFLSILSIFTILLIFSCKSNQQKEEEITDLENIFEVNSTKCADWKLPTTKFKLSYPTDDNLEVLPAISGQNNLNYITFQYYQDSVFIESLGFGYLSNSLNATDAELKKTLDELVAIFQTSIPTLKVISKEKEKFKGKDVFIAKMEFEVTEELTNIGEIGNYRTMIVFYPANDYNLKNGISFIFTARKDSDIKNFDDFGKKGKLEGIFNTFRFVK